MPPVVVHPVCWRHDDGIIYGRANPIQFDDGHCEWGVELPAPTVLFVGADDVLRRILCHEFAHCFWYITEIVRRMAEGTTELTTTYDGAIGSERQEQSDKELLADPTGWFGKRDVEQFMGDYDNPCLAASTNAIVTQWIGRDRPTICPDLRFAVSEIAIRPDHLSRAESLLQAEVSRQREAKAAEGP
jgi:hypothetical protein